VTITSDHKLTSLTSRLALFAGFRTRSFLRRFSQSVDMPNGTQYLPWSTRARSSCKQTFQICC